jgi:hypothetical protein
VAAAAPAPAPVEDEKKDKDGKKSKKKDGTLLISSKPACDIVIDGKETGLRTPQRGIKLKPGKHQVVLVNRDFGIKKKLTVKIASGRSTKVVKDLRDPLDE